MTKSKDAEIEDKVKQLKEKFNYEKNSLFIENPSIFHKFLAARNFNLEQAQAMLEKHIKWRKEWNVEKLIHEKIISEEFEAYLPHTTIGVDKDQAEVIYVALGNFDVKGLFSTIKFKDRIGYAIQIMENQRKNLEKQSEKSKRFLKGVVAILDMNHLTFAKATYKKGIDEAIYVAGMLQDNYPEHLKRVIVINASSYFTIAMAMIKNFIAASILEKLQIYGSEDEWKPILLNMIDDDVLPAFLGGKKTDPDGDPMCKTFIRHGAIIPTHMHTSKKIKSFAKSKDAKKLVLGRASFSEIELDVPEPGSVIEWEFETKTRDIGFGLFLTEIAEDGEEKISELVPLLRLETDQFSETGVYKCEKAGKYVILFDNSYSWVRSKEIYYKANVITPSEHEAEMKQNSNI